MNQDPIESALAWKAKGHKVALACVLATWGSAPRPAGSFLAIRDDGVFVGSVSGGCVEGDVISNAHDAMSTSRPLVLDYGVANAKAWEVGLACGGKISILLFALDKTAILQELQTCRTQKQACALAMNTKTAQLQILKPGADPDFNEGLALSLKNDKATTIEVDGKDWFLSPFNPPLKLLLIGAVHIAQALAPMAQQCGYEVTIIDPRSAFADVERFKDIKLLSTWPDDALNAIEIDERTAIATLTHDPKIDDVALQLALKSQAFYIGCLGSKKTHGERLKRLAHLGFQDKELARLHGPIGLNIGAKSPSEIAVSIMAQVIHILRAE